MEKKRNLILCISFVILVRCSQNSVFFAQIKKNNKKIECISDTIIFYNQHSHHTASHIALVTNILSGVFVGFDISLFSYPSPFIFSIFKNFNDYYYYSYEFNSLFAADDDETFLQYLFICICFLFFSFILSHSRE